MQRKYLKMLEAMESKPAEAGPKEWSVYILRCVNGTLYTGIAKDVQTRYRQHETGKGASYTRIYPPKSLAYQEGPFTRSGALIREAEIKRMPKARKEKFLKTAAGEEAKQ